MPLSVSSHLDQLSRRRPVSAPRMAHTASQPGSPYGTDKNAITPPPPRTNSPRRAGVDSVVAPWSNPANMYDQARNGKRTAVSMMMHSLCRAHRYFNILLYSLRRVTNVRSHVSWCSKGVLCRLSFEYLGMLLTIYAPSESSRLLPHHVDIC